MVKFIPGLNFVGIAQFVFVRIEDAHSLMGVPIKLMADLRQTVDGFDRVVLPSLTVCRPLKQQRNSE